MNQAAPLLFNFAGLTIGMDAELPLRLNNNFTPFVVAGIEPDCSFQLRAMETLDECDGDILFDGLEYTAIRQSNGSIIRVFKDHRNADKKYAVCYSEPEKGFSEIRYLKGSEQFFSEINNSIFHGDWEKLLLWRNRLILHAACIRTQFGGILFSGSSGIGKSTQAHLWETYESAVQINGDRPILYKDGAGWLAAGSPYAGSSRVWVPQSVPIRAIVMLQQGKNCSLRRLNTLQAFQKLYSCSTVYSWDDEYVRHVLDLVQQLAVDIPVYELKCTPDQKAVQLLKSEFERKEH